MCAPIINYVLESEVAIMEHFQLSFAHYYAQKIQAKMTQPEGSHIVLGANQYPALK